jgi:hypothetical protein
MNPFIAKIKAYFKPQNEDWVIRALKQKQKKPLVISVVIALGIFSYYLYESYILVDGYEKKITSTKQKMVEYKKKIKKLDQLMIMQENKVVELKNLSVASKQPIAVLTKVCELLKNRDVIGSFYIIKRKNKKYSNVLDIEIQVSYGDKELLLTIVQLVMDKVFYLKSIKQTKIGVQCEIYKPVKK